MNAEREIPERERGRDAKKQKKTRREQLTRRKEKRRETDREGEKRRFYRATVSRTPQASFSLSCFKEEERRVERDKACV